LVARRNQQLEETIEFLSQAVDNLENDCRVFAKHRNCEPKLDKYGLYPTTGNRTVRNKEVEILLTIWNRASGGKLSEIADDLEMNVSDVKIYADKLARHGIIKIRRLK
jgi:aminopeptidase-like protein